VVESGLASRHLVSAVDHRCPGLWAVGSNSASGVTRQTGPCGLALPWMAMSAGNRGPCPETRTYLDSPLHDLSTCCLW